MKINEGVKVKSTDLHATQRALGRGSKTSPQAIIPMMDLRFGDPHTLSKSWGSGSMWWRGWNDIQDMQRQCAAAGLPDDTSAKPGHTDKLEKNAIEHCIKIGKNVKVCS